MRPALPFRIAAARGCRSRSVVFIPMLALIASCGTVAPATETAHPPLRGTQLPVAPTSAATRPVPTTASDPWQSLRRPLVLPTMPAGAACPKTPSKPVNPDSGLFAAGDGPAYPAGLGAFNGAITRPGAVGATQGIRLDWFVAPRYSGPVLVRGGQIDGVNDVRFSSANPTSGVGFSLNPELQLTGMGDVPSGFGWRRWNTYLETTVPGCYALQMDGASFSTIVVIEVVPG